MKHTAVATDRSSAPPLVVVPRLFPGGTVACLATGPSLTQADVDYVRGRVDGVIAVSDSFRLAPTATALFSCDQRWWSWNWKKGASQFAGLKYALDPRARQFQGVQVLNNTGLTGLELNPTGLRTGKNSGFQSIGLAVHLGAAKIVLLGFDMKGTHFFGKHENNSVPPFALCLRLFQTIVQPLKDIGVDVINCTPKTALHAFRCLPLREALP